MRSIDTCIIVMHLQAEGVCVFTVKVHFQYLPFIVVCLQFGGMFKGT